MSTTAGAGAGAPAPRRARATLVPGRSLHGGMSGSRYDRVEVKPLSGASYALGSTIKALVESNRARRARGTDARSPKASSLNVEELAALEHTARVELDKGAEARRGPAPNRIMLDRAHLETLEIVFSLLDTDLDGRLTDSQLRTAITAVGLPPTRRFMLKLKASVPAGQGVDFEAFVAGVERKLIDEPIRMTDVDELFDVVADGSASAGDRTASFNEVQHVLAGIATTQSTQLSQDEVKDIMAELRIPRGERIVVRDFVKAMSSGFVQFEE